MEKKNLLISFSGGRTSAYMAWWIITNLSHLYNIIVVFANTGKEKEETLEFIDKCDKHFGLKLVWLEYEPNPDFIYGAGFRIVGYITAARKGEPFERVIEVHGLPNVSSPHCSREMKENTIRAYARSIGWVGQNYKTAIGIRADEPGRLNYKKAKRKNLIYPLHTMHRTTKSDVNRFWIAQSFDLQLKSYEGNCDLCWKKSIRKLMTIAKDNPEVLAWWREMESKYENFIPQHRKENKELKIPIRIFRDNLTVEEIEHDAGFPFDPARDESKDVDKWKTVSLWDGYLDPNLDCVESCEAF